MENHPLILILVRHGQTAWNKAQRFQGQSNVPLDDTGLAQAGRVAQRLASINLEAIYSSDLTRARQTAQQIANQRACPIYVDERLRELNFGRWEGMCYAEIGEKYPEQLRAWEIDPVHFAPPEGESLSQMISRLEEFLGDVRAKHVSGNVVIAAHGGSLQVILCLALNHPPTLHWQFSLAPGSLSELAFYPAGVILNRLNETVDER